MRRIVAKRERRCFGRAQNFNSSNVFSTLNHLQVITKQCRQRDMMDKMFHLLCAKFVKNVAPGTCFNRQRKQNNSPLSFNG